MTVNTGEQKTRTSIIMAQTVTKFRTSVIIGPLERVRGAAFPYSHVPLIFSLDHINVFHFLIS